MRRLGSAAHCPRYDLPVPDLDEDDIYNDLDFIHSRLRPNGEAGDLEGLARNLGFWLDTGECAWNPLATVERLDLLYRP